MSLPDPLAFKLTLLFGFIYEIIALAVRPVESPLHRRSGCSRRREVQHAATVTQPAATSAKDWM